MHIWENLYYIYFPVETTNLVFFIILSSRTANTQHKCDLIFIFIHFIVLAALSHCSPSDSEIYIFFLQCVVFEEVVKVITCIVRGLRVAKHVECKFALEMKIDMRLSATILIKSDEIDDGIFYIFFYCLLHWASHSLHANARNNANKILCTVPIIHISIREGKISD